MRAKNCEFRPNLKTFVILFGSNLEGQENIWGQIWHFLVTIFKRAYSKKKKMRKPLLDFCLNMIFKQFQHF